MSRPWIYGPGWQRDRNTKRSNPIQSETCRPTLKGHKFRSKRNYMINKLLNGNLAQRSKNLHTNKLVFFIIQLEQESKEWQKQMDIKSIFHPYQHIYNNSMWEFFLPDSNFEVATIQRICRHFQSQFPSSRLQTNRQSLHADLEFIQKIMLSSIFFPSLTLILQLIVLLWL